MGRISRALFAASLASSVAGVAFAQDEPAPSAQTEPASGTVTPEIVEARRHYAQGVVFFRAGRHAEADAEFTEAYRLWQNPTILYSLGQANERLLRVPRAIAYYRRYLAQAPPDAENRQEVQDTIRGLGVLLAEIRFESNVPATVVANDEEIGRSPGTIQLALGRYRFELRAEGYEPARRTESIAARVDRTLRFTLHRPPERRVVVRQGGLSPGWFWAGVAGTGLATIGAAVLGVTTLSLHSDLDAQYFVTAGERNHGVLLAGLTDVTTGGALLLGTATLLLYLNTNWETP